jgi:hypothetical protein
MSTNPVTDSSSAGAGNGRGQAARLLAFAAVAVSVFVLSLGPISDGDIYWHLAAGRYIVQHRSLPRFDPFTLSAAGRPWTDVHWLFQLGAFALCSAFGFVGLAVAKSTVLAGGAVLLAWTAERSGGPHARLACAFAVLGGLILDRHLVPLRPGLLTMLFLAVFLLALEELRRMPGRARWPLLLLPLVQVAWSNCQGLALLGPALIAAYLGSGWLSSRGFHWWPFLPEEPAAARPLGALLVACLLASIVTPYGAQALMLPIQLLARIIPGQGNVFSAAVAENISPFVLERTAPELVWHFKWVLVLVALLIALLRPRFHLAHLVVLFAFLALALLANRNLPLFYWILPTLIVTAFASGSAAAARPRRLRAPRLGRVFAVLLVGESGLALWLAAHEPAAGSPTPFHFPAESARRLVERQVTGPVFAADLHGGYLTFIAPSLQPYIDTRLILHTAQEYADYLALFEQPERFDRLAERERFRAVVLPTAYPDRYLGLIWHLARSSDWHLAYTDGYEVLFLPDGPDLNLDERTTVDSILREQAARFGLEGRLAETARLHLARLLVLLGQAGQANYVLEGLASRAAAQLRARAHFVAGERSAAEALAHVLLVQDPHDVRSLVLLAESSAGRGQAAQAVAWLRRALAIDPYDAEARSLLDRLDRLDQRATSRQADEASRR